MTQYTIPAEGLVANSAHELAAMIQSGEVTSREVTQAFLDRIAEVDGELTADGPAATLLRGRPVEAPEQEPPSVADSAVLDITADAAVNAGYGAAGERCMAISVVLATDAIADELGFAKDDVVWTKATFNSVVQPGDTLFVTEKIVAITQGRSFLVEEITPRPLARFLSRYVVKTSYGIGLGMPETMEMALRECGTPRILFAAAVSAVTKLFGRRGDFYRIAGDKARAIDGPTDGTIPPYDRAVVLGPTEPDAVAERLKAGRVAQSAAA